MSEFSVNAKIGANASGFFGTLRKVEQETKGVGMRIQSGLAGALQSGLLGPAAAGLGIGAGLYTSISAVGDYVRELRKLHESSGLAYRDLQIYEAEAKKHGVTLEQIDGAIDKITVTRAKALSQGGNSESAAAFQKLGVSFKQLQDLSPAEVFKRIQTNIANMGDAALVADAAVATMGKGFLNMDVFMSKTFEEMESNAMARGLIVSNETIGEIIANQKVLESQWQGFRASVGAPVFANILYSLNLAVATVTLLKAGLDSAFSIAVTKAQRMAHIVSGGVIGISKEIAEAQLKANDQATDAAFEKFHKTKAKMDLPAQENPIAKPTVDANGEAIFDENAANSRASKLADLEKQITAQREANALKGLSAEERRNELLRRQAELRAKLAELEKTKAAPVPERVQRQNALQAENSAKAETDTAGALARLRSAQDAYDSEKRTPGLTDDVAQRQHAAILKQLSDAQYDYNAALKKEKEIKEAKTPEQKAFALKAQDETNSHKLAVMELQKKLAENEGALIEPNKNIKTSSPDALQRIGGTRGNVDPGQNDRKVLIQEVKEIKRGITDLPPKIAKEAGIA